MGTFSPAFVSLVQAHTQRALTLDDNALTTFANTDDRSSSRIALSYSAVAAVVLPGIAVLSYILLAVLANAVTTRCGWWYPLATNRRFRFPTGCLFVKSPLAFCFPSLSFLFPASIPQWIGQHTHRLGRFCCGFFVSCRASIFF
ncbi:hypothetical protein BX070DRAFT_113480 [Coemansia spiralis]|nr:hypothetical protein BX070DRAFT_113480 [Coemansia spiralis]